MKKQKKTYVLFTILGLSVLILTLFEIVFGIGVFFLVLYSSPFFGPLFGIGLIYGLYALALTATTLAFECKGDRVLCFLGVITIPYALFAAANVLYVFTSFFDPFVVANDIVEVVSVVFSLTCIAAGIWYAIMKSISQS